MAFDLPDPGVSFEKPLIDAGVDGPQPQGQVYQEKAREHETEMDALKNRRERAREQ